MLQFSMKKKKNIHPISQYKYINYNKKHPNVQHLFNQLHELNKEYEWIKVFLYFFFVIFDRNTDNVIVNNLMPFGNTQHSLPMMCDVRWFSSFFFHKKKFLFINCRNFVELFFCKWEYEIKRKYIFMNVSSSLAIF